MNWLVRRVSRPAENDLLHGFCDRCRAAGMPLSRAIVFIDTLHPIFEGRGFRWNDGESNEAAAFDNGSTSTGDAKPELAAVAFYHMLQNGHDEMVIDLADNGAATSR